MKKILSKLIPIVISLVALYFFFRKVDFGHLLDALTGLHIGFIALSLFFVLIGVFCKALRWTILVSSLKEKVSYKNVFSCLGIGFLCEYILPAKAGEFIRAYLLGQKEKISRTSVFGTVVIERILDIFIILNISLVIVFTFAWENEYVKQAIAGGGTIFIVLISGIVLFLFQKNLIQKVVRFILPERFSEKICTLMDKLHVGLISKKRFDKIGLSFLVSLVMWFFVLLSFLPILYSFDFGTPLPGYTVFVLLLFVVFGLSIPSAPGNIGVFEYATFLAISICLPAEVAKEAAVIAKISAFSLVFHVIQILPEIIIGIIMFNREHITWSSLQNFKQLMSNNKKEDSDND